MFFSPKQVAESLGVSGSTVRRYAATFGDLLSDYANPGAGRRRSFSSADVEMLRQIQSFLGAGLSEQEARAQLAVHRPPEVRLRETGDSTYETLAALADQKPLLEAQARQIADQGERIGRLEVRVDRLAQEIETLKASR